MTEDPRCCGSGTCIIDAAGRCWCGQQWDGEKMCHAPRTPIEGHAAVADAAPERPMANPEGAFWSNLPTTKARSPDF